MNLIKRILGIPDLVQKHEDDIIELKKAIVSYECIKDIKNRLDELENPFLFDIGDSVYFTQQNKGVIDRNDKKIFIIIGKDREKFKFGSYGPSVSIVYNIIDLETKKVFPVLQHSISPLISKPKK